MKWWNILQKKRWLSYRGRNKFVASVAVILIAAIFLCVPFFSSPVFANTSGGCIACYDSTDPGGHNSEISSWYLYYPDLFNEGGIWEDYPPEALKFYLPDYGFMSLFDHSTYIQIVQNNIANDKLSTSIGNVFSSLEHIRRTTDFTIFNMMLDFLNPITDAVWSYVSTYWLELFFTLGIAYLLVGLVTRKFVWLMIRFLILMLLSGFMIALFHPSFHMWDRTLTKLHAAMNEHTQHILNISTQKSGIQSSGNYVTDVGNALYQLNVIYPFMAAQFGQRIDSETIAAYFRTNSDQERREFVQSFLGTEKEVVEEVIRQRSRISTRMVFTTYFAYITYMAQGFVSILIEIFLVFLIIPLMLSLIFASLPTDDHLGHIWRRLSTLAKLLLGKLAMAFIISVGAYVNVFIMNKVNLNWDRVVDWDGVSNLSIEDAQLLVIITYIFTLAYCWFLLRWIWKRRDEVAGRAKSYLMQGINTALRVRHHKQLREVVSSTNTGQSNSTGTPPRSKPREKPIEFESSSKTRRRSTSNETKPSNSRVRSNHSGHGSTYASRSIRSRPRSSPIQRGT